VCVCVCVYSELSEVLWHFFIQMPLSMAVMENLRWVLLFCSWAIWAVLTVAILLLMEGLSAFLHTLRLHWSARHVVFELLTDNFHSGFEFYSSFSEVISIQCPNIFTMMVMMMSVIRLCFNFSPNFLSFI